jgi:hypothetical protein
MPVYTSADAEPLYLLIKSLSKAEKRYFKLFASGYGTEKKSHYIRLFDHYEACLRSGKTGGELNNGRHLTVYKHRLYQLILKSLNAFHAENSADSRIRGAIGDITVLLNKALYKAAHKALQKAKKLVLHYEKWPYMLQLLHLERQLYTTRDYEGFSETVLRQITEQENQALEYIKNTQDYWVLGVTLYLSYRTKGHARSEDLIAGYRQLLDSPLLRNTETGLCFEARVRYYATNVIANLGIGDMPEAYRFARKAVQHIEQHPQQIAEDPVRYSITLHNYLLSMEQLGYFHEFFKTLPKMKELADKYSDRLHESKRLFILVPYYNFQLCAAMETGQPEIGLALIPEIEQLIEQKKVSDITKVYLQSNIAMIHFLAGQYRQALVYINTFLNENKNSVRKDAFAHMRIMQLLTLLELGDYDLLAYLCKSAYRYLYKRHELYKTENLLISFINTFLSNPNDKSIHLEAYKNLRDDLIEVQKDPLEATFIRIFDLIAWTESKIEQLPLAYLFRKRHGFLKEGDFTAIQTIQNP